MFIAGIKNTIEFCILNWYHAIWINSLVSPSSFFAYLLGIFTYTIISFENTRKFYFFLCNIYIPVILLSCLPQLLGSPENVEKSSESIYPYLFPVLEGRQPVLHY